MLRVPIVFLWLSTEITIGASTSSEQPSTVAAYQPLWRYDDETKWPGHRCRAGGRRQSPIDINTAEVVPDIHRKFIKNGPLLFKGYDGVLVTGINNGHTIQFSTEGEEAMHPRLTGGPLKYLYRLEQLHFHWLAEHAINGYKHPMEMHFVHVRTDLSVNEALAKRDGLAIIAVFCEVLSVLDDAPEDVSELMQYVPQLMKTGDRISGILLDMRKLLSVNTMSYYAYSGSLTSPKCNEAVTWIIFPVPINISDSQYKMFGKISSGRHNYRRLQKVNQHVVYTPASIKVPVPQIVIFFDDMIRILGSFFKDMTSLVKGSVARIGIKT